MTANIPPSMRFSGGKLRQFWLCWLCVVAVAACGKEPDPVYLVEHDVPFPDKIIDTAPETIVPDGSVEEDNIPLAAFGEGESAPLDLRLADDSDVEQSLALRNRYKQRFRRLDKVIAIVIDDVGVDQKRSLEAVQLEGVYTISFLPYGRNLDVMTGLARQRQHDVLIHQGAEPMSSADPGPGALRVGMGAEEIATQIMKSQETLPAAIGISNHMGSKFNRWIAGVEVMLESVQSHELIYLDSFTDKYSQGLYQAAQKNYPALGRDVFIDGERTPEAVRVQLKRTRDIAERQGFAVAIGHPYDITLAILPEWQAQLRQEGFQFVTISALWQMLTTKTVLTP